MEQSQPQVREDIIERSADVFRPVVHLEIAYDIIDELASSPEKYSESLYKLARLATKVYNQLKSRENELRKENRENEPRKENYAEAYKYILGRLENSAKTIESLHNYLKNLDEKVKRSELKRFAALVISLDRYTTSIKEAMK